MGQDQKISILDQKKESPALKKIAEEKRIDTQYRKNMQDNDIILVNPVFQYMNVAFKFFPKNDSLFHGKVGEGQDLQCQPDVIMNDNKLIMLLFEFEYLEQHPDYIENKVK